MAFDCICLHAMRSATPVIRSFPQLREYGSDVAAGNSLQKPVLPYALFKKLNDGERFRTAPLQRTCFDLAAWLSFHFARIPLYTAL